MAIRTYKYICVILISIIIIFCKYVVLQTTYKMNRLENQYFDINNNIPLESNTYFNLDYDDNSISIIEIYNNTVRFHRI